MPAFDFNGALDHSRVTGRMVRQAQRREARAADPRRATREQVAACANKQRFRAEFGASNAKVQKLYGLCAEKGL